MQRLLIVLCLAACVRAADEKTKLAEFSGALERLAARVAPAVVQVQFSGWCASRSAGGQDAATLGPCRVVGSGVIVDPSGYILTNEHVVRNARSIREMLTPKSTNQEMRWYRQENSKFWIPSFWAQIANRWVNGTGGKPAVVQIERNGLFLYLERDVDKWGLVNADPSRGRS